MIRHRKTTRGFTAVEIAMVASVIAILALLILPIFRQRAEDARRVAAQDEVGSLAKALLLVEADMPGGNYLPRLNDLDNSSYTTKTPADPDTTDLDPPQVKWDRATGEFVVVADVEYFNSIVPNWKGPYIAQKNTISLRALGDGYVELTDVGGSQGPIRIFDAAYSGGTYDSAALDADRYPIDPWGTPYLLFGPEETIYNVRVIYSLGPNGVPGNAAAPVAADYNRRTGTLGTGDDFFYIF